MKSKKYIPAVGLLLLFLMLCKVSAFHVYTHQDEPSDTIENCSICDVAVETQKADLIVPAIDAVVSKVFFQHLSKSFCRAITLFVGDLYATNRHCRPPPSLV